jgi:hypothetical protein
MTHKYNGQIDFFIVIKTVNASSRLLEKTKLEICLLYLNLLYSRADTGHFFRRTSATLLTDSAGDVIPSDGNNRMIRLFQIIE